MGQACETLLSRFRGLLSDAPPPPARLAPEAEQEDDGPPPPPPQELATPEELWPPVVRMTRQQAAENVGSLVQITANSGPIVLILLPDRLSSVLLVKLLSNNTSSPPPPPQELATPVPAETHHTLPRMVEMTPQQVVANVSSIVQVTIDSGPMLLLALPTELVRDAPAVITSDHLAQLLAKRAEMMTVDNETFRRQMAVGQQVLDARKRLWEKRHGGGIPLCKLLSTDWI